MISNLSSSSANEKSSSVVLGFQPRKTSPLTTPSGMNPAFWKSEIKTLTPGKTFRLDSFFLLVSRTSGMCPNVGIGAPSAS